MEYDVTDYRRTVVDRRNVTEILAKFKREHEVRLRESRETFYALAEIDPHRAWLAYLALPALHDEDGSLNGEFLK